MNDLKHIRSAWYQAFFKGDIETLKQHEAEDFVFISSAGIETNNRYSNIQARVDSGAWFKAEVHQEEHHLELKLLSDECVLITGAGETKTDQRSFGAVYFSEVWRKQNNHWRVESLHVSTADRIQ